MLRDAAFRSLCGDQILMREPCAVFAAIITWRLKHAFTPCCVTWRTRRATHPTNVEILEQEGQHLMTAVLMDMHEKLTENGLGSTARLG